MRSIFFSFTLYFFYRITNLDDIEVNEVHLREAQQGVMA